jgi:hypothetical protein
MQVNSEVLFAQLDKIDQQLQSGELESAVAEALTLHHALVDFFSNTPADQLDLVELNGLRIALNIRIELLKKRQIEVQNEVAALGQVGSNKVSRTYLAK